MSNKYVIRWKSKMNGRTGQGTKFFEREEADRLAEELNREYPQIHHEIAEVEVEELPQEQPVEQAPLSNETNEAPLLSIA